MMKNCEPLVFGPALAIDRSIGFSCFISNVSSGVSHGASVLVDRRTHLRTAVSTSFTPRYLTHLLAVDRLAAGSVVTGKVTALEHEAGVRRFCSPWLPTYPLMQRWKPEPA